MLRFKAAWWWPATYSWWQNVPPPFQKYTQFPVQQKPQHIFELLLFECLFLCPDVVDVFKQWWNVLVCSELFNRTLKRIVRRMNCTCVGLYWARVSLGRKAKGTVHLKISMNDIALCCSKLVTLFSIEHYRTLFLRNVGFGDRCCLVTNVSQNIIFCVLQK